MNNKQKIHIGDKYITNNCGEIEVVEYKSCSEILVKFTDGTTVLCSSAALRKGRVRNPMKPFMNGYGFIGIGKYRTRTHPKCYKVWNSMLMRCYSEEVQAKHPTYKGCTVREDWLNFQNFAEFYYSDRFRQDGWELDKDIIVQGNKVYSIDTCCFVPSVINVLFCCQRQSESGIRGGIL